MTPQHPRPASATPDPAVPDTAVPDPATLVTDYLAAMEARDLDTARALLSDRFEMVFPGTGPMTALADLVAWAGHRYRFVRKSHRAVEAFDAGGGAAIVYIRGTLSGEWPDGRGFEGVRFIDRFEVSGGRIVRQEVWNDLAESRAR